MSWTHALRFSLALGLLFPGGSGSGLARGQEENSEASAERDWVTVIYRLRKKTKIIRALDGSTETLKKGATFEAYLPRNLFPEGMSTRDVLERLRPDLGPTKFSQGYEKMLCHEKLADLEAQSKRGRVPVQARFGPGFLDAAVLQRRAFSTVQQIFTETRQKRPPSVTSGDIDGTACDCGRNPTLPALAPFALAENAMELAISQYASSRAVGDAIGWARRTVDDRHAAEAVENARRRKEGKPPITLPAYGGIGCCATYVSRALRNAGLTRTAALALHAKDSGNSLVREGFLNILGDKYPTPQKAPRGAVLVFDGVPDGHIELKSVPAGQDGYISDFESPAAHRGGKLLGIYIKPSADGR